jgi:hypothetical protein
VEVRTDGTSDRGGTAARDGATSPEGGVVVGGEVVVDGCDEVRCGSVAEEDEGAADDMMRSEWSDACDSARCVE